MKVLPCLKRPKLDGREAEVGQYLKNKTTTRLSRHYIIRNVKKEGLIICRIFDSLV